MPCFQTTLGPWGVLKFQMRKFGASKFLLSNMTWKKTNMREFFAFLHTRTEDTWKENIDNIYGRNHFTRLHKPIWPYSLYAVCILQLINGFSFWQKFSNPILCYHGPKPYSIVNFMVHHHQLQFHYQRPLTKCKLPVLVSASNFFLMELKTETL